MAAQRPRHFVGIRRHELPCCRGGLCCITHGNEGRFDFVGHVPCLSLCVVVMHGDEIQNTDEDIRCTQCRSESHCEGGESSCVART